MKKLISVIVPIYRGNKYINYIMNMMQLNVSEFKGLKDHSIELILVNDFPKEPLVIPQKVDRKFDLVTIELDKNRGIHGARVEGLKRASGKYILFLDQDDKIEDTYLLSQWKNIKQYDAIVCNGVYKSNRSVHVVYSKDNPPDIINQLWRHCFLGNSIPSPGHVLLRRSAIPLFWTNEIMKYNGTDDWLLWLLMIKEKKQFKFNPKVLFVHSYNGRNTSRQYDKMHQSGVEMVNILKRNRIFHPFIIQALKRENEYVYIQKMKAVSLISKIRFWDKKILKDMYEKIYLPRHKKESFFDIKMQ